MTTAGCIRTHSGVLVNILNPDPDTIIIEDIIHSLCHQCRYNGHSFDFYSVGEHSIYVSQFVREENRLWGLLHDASEAYLCDIPRPLKPLLTNYREIEFNLEMVIARKFNLSWPMPLDVKQVDSALLLPECDRLLPNSQDTWNSIEGAPDLREKVTIACYTPAIARHYFWQRYKELTH